MSKRTSMEQWIKEARTDLDKSAPIRALQLIHKIGQTDEEVHTTRLGNGNRTDKDLAEMFQAKAETFAQDLAGIQTFGLLAFYGDNTHPEARYPFMVRGKLDYSEEGNATEEPTEKGQKQQIMRHTEMLAQGYMKGMQTLLTYMGSTIDSQSKHIRELSQENREAMGIVKEVMLAEATRQANNKLQLLKYERETAERTKWMKLLPAIANGVLGREVFPQHTEDTALVEGVIERMGDQDIEKLSMVLPQEIMAPLAQRAARYWKEKREVNEEAKRLAEAMSESTDIEQARKELNP